MVAQPGAYLGQQQQQQQEDQRSNASRSLKMAIANGMDGDAAFAADGIGKEGTLQSAVLHAPHASSSKLGSTLADAMPYTPQSTLDALQVPGRSGDGHSTDEASSSTPILATSSTDMSTPEAHWGSITNGLSSAPLVTLTSDPSIDQDLFDLNNRPYTPSYSAGDFSDILSDQDEFLKSFGDQIDGVSFAFGAQSGGVAPSFDYDPDTADSYSHLNSTLLSQNLLGGGTSSGGQKRSQTLETIRASSAQGHKASAVPTFAFTQEGGYRDTAGDTQLSPIASPLLGPVSSPLRTRHSSFGSSAEFSSPNPGKSDVDPAFQQMQTLGQRMTLHDPVVVRPSDDQNERNAFSRTPQSGSLFFAPVFEEDGQEPASNDGGRTEQDQASVSGSAYPSYTYSSAKQDDGGANAGLPSLAINDSAMQFEQGQSIDEGVQRAQQYPPSSQQQQWASDMSGTSTAPLPDDVQAASYASLAHGGTTFAGHEYPSLTRVANNIGDGGSYAEPVQTHGSSGGAEQDYQQNAKRQDSYDRVRKYLRLDVDMGFQADRDVSNHTAPRRQRSYSDVGIGYKEGGTANAYEQQESHIPSPPPFVVVQGGVTDKTPVAMSSGVDWATEAAKQRRLQQQMAPPSSYQGANNYSYSGSAATASMDPHLLQQQIQQQGQLSTFSQPQYEPASGPVRQREGSFSGRGAAPYPSHSRTSSASSASFVPLAPFGGAAEYDDASNYATGMSASSTGLLRSHSQRGQRSRHSRLAQSEDLSQMARMSNPTEFLNRITAPDGSLAPPNTQLGPPLGMAPPTSSFAGVSRSSLSRINTGVQEQQQQNAYPAASHMLPSFPTYGTNGRIRSPDEAQMLAMNRYGSVRSVSSPQNSQAIYSQTYSPLYGALHPAPQAGQSAYEMEARAYPIVQQVTTSATQAASASRRKNEAIHVCPIAGCGSTFTRKFNLNGHIRSHTGERPYVCRAPGCTKSFARSFDLSRHEKLHAGIKPHTCDSCGKSFARADALARHLRNDAGNGGCLSRNSDAESTFDGSSSSQHGGSARGGVGAATMGSAVGIDVGQDDNEENNKVRASEPNTSPITTSKQQQQNRFKGHIL